MCLRIVFGICNSNDIDITALRDDLRKHGAEIDA